MKCQDSVILWVLINGFVKKWADKQCSRQFYGLLQEEKLKWERYDETWKDTLGTICGVR